MSSTARLRRVDARASVPRPCSSSCVGASADERPCELVSLGGLRLNSKRDGSSTPVTPSDPRDTGRDEDAALERARLTRCGHDVDREAEASSRTRSASPWSSRGSRGSRRRPRRTRTRPRCTVTVSGLADKRCAAAAGVIARLSTSRVPTTCAASVTVNASTSRNTMPEQPHPYAARRRDLGVDRREQQRPVDRQHHRDHHEPDQRPGRAADRCSRRRCCRTGCWSPRSQSRGSGSRKSTPRPRPNARITPIVESRSARARRAAPIADRERRAHPTSAPASALSATRRPAAAPVNASSLVPCTANAMPRVTTNGPISPHVIATSAPAINACCANGSER